MDIKDIIIPLTVLFVVLALFCFFWQMAAAGHWQGFEGIHLTSFDKIPLDLMAVGILIPALAIFGEYYLYSSRLLKALWGNSYSLFCLSVYHLLCHPLQGRNGAEEQCRLVCH